MVRVRVKIEKKTLYGKALARIRAKMIKTYFLVRLWLK